MLSPRIQYCNKNIVFEIILVGARARSTPYKSALAVDNVVAEMNPCGMFIIIAADLWLHTVAKGCHSY